MDHIEDLLRNLALFKSFPPAQLRNLIEQCEVRTFAPQEAIIHYGQPGRFLGVILDGRAEAVITNEMGDQQRIGTLKQGDFLGEISLLTGEPTVADVLAVNKCELLLIPQEIFTTFLAVNADALKVMARTITERLRWRENDKEAQSRVEDAWKKSTDPYGLRLSTASPMKILALNAGFSQLKFGYFDTGREENNIDGSVDGIGTENARVSYSSARGRMRRRIDAADHVQALQAVIALLTDEKEGVLRAPDKLTAVGHKVTHGGDRYGNAVIIDEQVLNYIESNAHFAPRHVPLNLAVLKASAELLPEVPQIAVFDTGFHQKMPPQAYLYGLPYELYDQDHIRKYGFHGISHQYAALVAATHVKQRFQELKIITCHLDEEASICAIDHGRSIDTSMGLSPLEGLMMRNRSGNLDPSVILYLLRAKDMSVDQVEEILNQQSGLHGLSGIEGDFVEIEEAANSGDHRAIMAIQAFCYQLRKYIGAYVSAMSGLDVLVFSGSIGTGSAWVRSLACQGLSYMGIAVDDVRNKMVPPRPQEVADISDESSRIKVLVLTEDEERLIARETVRTLGYWNVPQAIQHQRERDIPIEVSAHHVHLSSADVDALFGPGYELSHRADLSQPGQYASQETVNLIGPRGRVERVRILGPERSQTQVEIAMTEEFKLGIKAPIRPSGDLEGSPGIVLEGPMDSLGITQGVICSVRHIHMSPEDALSFGLKDRDICMVRVEGDRTLIFGDVLVRVNPDYRLAMHIDTDEANAASIRTGMIGHLVGVQDR